MHPRVLSRTPVNIPLPRPLPGTAVLEGRLVRLERTDPERHAAGLYAGISGKDGEAVWEYLAYGPFPHQAAFEKWMERSCEESDPAFYTVKEKATGRLAGLCSFMRMDPGNAVLEVGHIWFAPFFQRSAAATEVVYLMLKYAFDSLGYRRVEWKCDAANAKSRRAAERFGFRYEGLFHQHQVVKGRNRDTSWYSMLDGEWPDARAAFEHWLDPENFDEQGNQKTRLRMR